MLLYLSVTIFSALSASLDNPHECGTCCCDICISRMAKLRPGEAIGWVIVQGGFPAMILESRAKSFISCYWREESRWVALMGSPPLSCLPILERLSPFLGRALGQAFLLSLARISLSARSAPAWKWVNLSAALYGRGKALCSWSHLVPSTWLTHESFTLLEHCESGSTKERRGGGLGEALWKVVI